MNEVGVSGTGQPDDIGAGAQPASSPGQLLRQGREQQHMTVQALASALKVPVYKLQALEEDRWDVLADLVFTRSLALSVCRLLRMPSDAVLAGLPKHEAVKLSAHPEGINAPFKDKTLRSLMTSSQESNSSNGVKAIAALLIAVAGGTGLYFLPEWQANEGDGAQVASVVVESAITPLQQAQQAQADEENSTALVESVLPAAPATEAEAANAAANVAAQSSAPAPTAGTAATSDVAPVLEPVISEATAVTVASAAPSLSTAEAAVTQTAEPAAAANGRVLRFTASGESWVQVRNAQRRVLLEKILKAGDVLEETLAGYPLQVVVGNAGATVLEVDGVTQDLATSARNNVARFEVK